MAHQVNPLPHVDEVTFRDGALEKCLWCCFGVWCCFGCERSRRGGGDEYKNPERQEARGVQLTVLLKFEMQDGGTKDIALSSLEQKLDLSYNQLSGPIPEQLGNLSALQELHLYNNQLSGPIPEQLGNLSALQWLNLSDNQLSGPIPEQLGNLSALQELHLSNNHLEGKVPPPLLMKLQIEVSLKIDGNSELTIGNVVSLEAPQFPVFLIPRDQLLNLSAFQKHEEMRKLGMVCKVECAQGYKLCNFSVTETKESLRREDCVFISHRWLQENHPDDDSQTKLQHVQRFAQQHSQYLYYWVDYACIPQVEGEDKCKAINSLPCYVKSCGALVTVYSDLNARSSLVEYKNRGWCRLEQLSSLVPLHTTRPRWGDAAKGELATTKLYLSEIGGDTTEFDLLKQGKEALMELNPLEGKFFDNKDKHRISECLTEMCKVLKKNAALEHLVLSIEDSQKKTS